MSNVYLFEEAPSSRELLGGKGAGLVAAQAVIEQKYRVDSGLAQNCG